MLKTTRTLFSLAIGIATCVPAAADVYRWTDDKGVIHYTDKPPAKDAKPAELPQLQTYKPNAPAASSNASSGAASKAPAGDASDAPLPASEIRIATPAPEETIRDHEGKISVVVAASLDQGQGIVYYLDGKAANPPTPSTGYLFTGVERGQHSVGASVVSSEGEEISRAAPVTVYMMPNFIRAPANVKSGKN